MKYEFGEKIRSVREKRGLTLKAVAQAIGVSESLISQIERNKVAPAVDTLLDIAALLNLDLEYLFSEYKKPGDVTVMKAGDRPRFQEGGASYEFLSRAQEGDQGIEAYNLELSPGGIKGSPDYGHVGKEMGILLQGSGELRCGGQVYPLEAGDSVSFSSDVPHVLVNTGNETLKAFWVVTPPKGFHT